MICVQLRCIISRLDVETRRSKFQDGKIFTGHQQTTGSMSAVQLAQIHQRQQQLQQLRLQQLQMDASQKQQTMQQQVLKSQGEVSSV